MRVLVRGGTGFVGRHVVWRALLSGYDTVFTGRSREAAAQVTEMAHRVSPDRRPIFHPEGHPLGEPLDVVSALVFFEGLVQVPAEGVVMELT